MSSQKAAVSVSREAESARPNRQSLIPGPPHIGPTHVSYLSLAENELLRSARTGNGQAFEELHRRYAKRLHFTASRFTKNQEDSEDAVQDTFLKAFSKLDSFEGHSSFYTWLTSILINTCLMQLRRKRKYMFLSLESHPEMDRSLKHLLADPKIDIEREFLLRQRAQVLSDAISALSPTLRAVLETYKEHDCSMAEIAQRHRISCPAVKSRLLRAKAVLRASYRLKKAR